MYVLWVQALIAKLLTLNPATQASTSTVSFIVFNNCLGGESRDLWLFTNLWHRAL